MEKNNQNKTLIEKLRESIYSSKALEELFVNENNKVINTQGVVINVYLVGGPQKIGRNYSFGRWKMSYRGRDKEERNELEDMCELQDYVRVRHKIYEQAPNEADSFVLVGENTPIGLESFRPLVIQYCKQEIKKLDE